MTYLPIASSFAACFGWAAFAAAVIYLLVRRKLPRVARSAARLAFICLAVSGFAEYARFAVLPALAAVQAARETAPWHQPPLAFRDL
jgi:hypothetical protein